MGGGSSSSILLSTPPCPLIVQSPECSWLGAGVKAIVFNGPPYNLEKYNGRGRGITLGSIDDAVLFKLEGSTIEKANVRVDQDEDLALEINFRKLEIGTELSLWSNKNHREWACQFSFNPDRTISPYDDRALVVGVKANTDKIILVSSTDELQRLIFQPPKNAIQTFSQGQSRREEERVALAEPFPLVFRSPECEWLGQGPKALVGQLPGYTLEHGRGCGVAIRPCAEAQLFSAEGKKSCMAIRLQDDQELSLEVNHRKFEVGDRLSLWYCKGHPEWACQFSWNSDNTLSPKGKSQQVVVGVVKESNGNSNLSLVAPGNPNELKFLSPTEARRFYSEQIEAQKKRAAEETAHMEELADAAASPENISRLVEDGFVRLQGLVPQPLVTAALREINRRLGAASGPGGVEEFKAKSFPSHPAVTDLFNRSALPALLGRLLAPGRPPRQGSGQLAIRFPGDACVEGTCDAPPAHFEGVRRGWHIDGCPNDFIPGITDHFGEVHNFDALVGVLLSRVEAPLAGELCCYPGSHRALARHFSAPGRLEELCRRGNGALPTGPATDEVLGGAAPAHCTGEPGDVFLANFMTAHFIAPNTSPHIRYAVYFRVRSPSYPAGVSYYPDAMLRPWLNWGKAINRGTVVLKHNNQKKDAAGQQDDDDGEEEEKAPTVAVRAAEQAVSTHTKIERLQNISQHHAIVDNFHVIQKVVFAATVLSKASFSSTAAAKYAP